MQVGYARTSTVEQDAGLEGQLRDLKAAGCEEMFAEQVSSVATVRPQLLAALKFVRKGDVLVVTKPDRLARSVPDLLKIIDDLAVRGIGLRIMSMGGAELDTRSPTAKLMLTMLGAVAAFERELMLERQREGIRKAASEGRYKGRVPTAQRQSAEATKLVAEGVSRAEVARRLGVSRASVYRIAPAAKEAAR